jgi:hypothetical protein
MNARSSANHSDASEARKCENGVQVAIARREFENVYARFHPPEVLLFWFSKSTDAVTMAQRLVFEFKRQTRRETRHTHTHTPKTHNHS